MAEESSTGGERTEPPSTKRRDDFRNKGQVAQSKEVQTAALLTILLLFWLFYLPTFWQNLLNLVSTIWQSAGETAVTPSSIVNIASFVIKEVGILLAPLFILVLLIGFFSSFFQIGWLFTTKPLVPDISKFNIIKGIGRFVSKKSFLEIIKSMAKVILIAWLAYTTIIDKFDEALILVDTSAVTAVNFIARTAGIILAKVCALLILIAFIDLLFVRWEMEEKMKMTKQEVKEEHKEAEGDPLIKAQIRAIQRDMARKRMMAEVPEADVVITNPTHISIAIRYDTESMDAPIVIAKGTNIIATRIREIARENDVPIVENPPVARLLHKVELGATIPAEMFKAVAEILAHVYSLKR